MKINNHFVKVFFLSVFFIVGFVHLIKAENVPTDLRFRYSGSSVFAIPTGKFSSSMSYINDDKNSRCFISQNIGNIIEVSVLRRLSGDNKNTNTINGKLALISEGKLMPAISLGVADVNTQLGDRIYFAAASKSFEEFGFSIHAGLYRDPINREKKSFFGAEKVIFPLLTIAAERCNDIDTYGIKISPYPGVSLDIAQRDGKEEMFNLVYSKSY
jgi:hypothetical protein